MVRRAQQTAGMRLTCGTLTTPPFSSTPLQAAEVEDTIKRIASHKGA